VDGNVLTELNIVSMLEYITLSLIGIILEFL
jgi:hypothetical protein